MLSNFFASYNSILKNCFNFFNNYFNSINNSINGNLTAANVIDNKVNENSMNKMLNNVDKKSGELDNLQRDYSKLKKENDFLEKEIQALLSVVDYANNEQKMMQDTINALEQLLEYSRMQAIGRHEEIEARKAVLELSRTEMIEMDKEIRAYENLMNLSDTEKIKKDNISKILKHQHKRLNETILQLLIQKSVSDVINYTLDLNVLLNFTFEKLNELFDFNKILFQIYDNDKNELVVKKLYMKSNNGKMNNYKTIFNPEDKYAVSKIIKSNYKDIFKENLNDIENVKSDKNRLINYYNKKIIFFPLYSQNQLLGIFQLEINREQITNREKIIETIENIFSLLIPAINNILLFQKLVVVNDELERKDNLIGEDLRIAKKMIDAMLEECHLKVQNFDSFVYFKPMLEIGGDIFDFEYLGSHKIRIFIADAVGHGIQAALVTMLIKSEYDKLKFRVSNPAILLKELNTSFYSKYKDLMLFFSCSLLDIDFNKNKIKISSAGHPAQLLIQGNKITELQAHGYMIGFSWRSTYPYLEFDIKTGDKVVLFTDGIYEEFSKDKFEFGYDKFLELIKESADKDIRSIGNIVINEVMDWIKDSEQFDDMTLILLQI